MNPKSLRIVFMGTPDFALGILKSLVVNQYSVVGVVTVADKPAGRGKQLTASPVKLYALEQKIPVLQPTNLKSETFIAELQQLQPDIQIIVAFRMLPKVVWQLAPLGTFNLHASLLPQYRGAAPINWAIINGDTKTGLTTFFIDDTIDTGVIILQTETDIAPDDNFETLHNKLLEKGGELVQQTVKLIAKGKVNTIAQPHIAPSLAPKLYKENTKINWDMSLQHIHHFVRGLSPYPAAWTSFYNEGQTGEFKIFSTRFEITLHQERIGGILTTKNEIKVVHKEGYLVILDLQLPGRKRMDAKSLLNGYRFSAEAKVL